MNPYPFHLEKDLVEDYLKLVKQSINDKPPNVVKLRKHFELLDSYSAFILEREILTRIAKRQAIDKLNLDKIEQLTKRKYFPNQEAKKQIQQAIYKQKQVYRQDVDSVSLINEDLGITQEFLDKTIKTNVALISKLSKDHKKKVAEIISKGLAEGKSNEEIAKEISNATGVTLKKARFWATDQANKFFGDVTRKRQKELGFPGFIWITVKDAKVRPTHIAFEGKFFDYEKGTGEPNRSFPGQDYRCRCYAKPAFPEDVDPHYSRKAEQERDKLKQQTEQAQVEFDDFYQRLTREAEETPYAEQGKPFIPSKIVATNEQLKEMFETTTKDFTETFEIDGTKLNQIIFREMIFQDAIKYQLEKDANGLPFSFWSL
ncbi:MAG: minor capsid protein [Leptospiraceae bacterium]|nr:minor capsid protein [Leptospiraceae bacterium]